MPFLARHERFDRVGSTNDVVRGWLAEGTPEVCLAEAAEQTAGRGRDGRTWQAPEGTGLLLSLGFRPTWLEPDAVWRLVAVSALAMAEAAERVADLPTGTVRLKWPNDLVIEAGPEGEIRKLAGLLGETAGLGSDDPTAVVGLGLNVDWAAADFPPELAATMSSLRAAADDRRIDPAEVLEDFLRSVEPRIEALRAGAFDATAWAERQVTTGRQVRLVAPDGDASVRALGVDPVSGGLIVEDPASPTGQRTVHVGEITHVRFAQPVAGGV